MEDDDASERTVSGSDTLAEPASSTRFKMALVESSLRLVPSFLFPEIRIIQMLEAQRTTKKEKKKEGKRNGECSVDKMRLNISYISQNF